MSQMRCEMNGRLGAYLDGEVSAGERAEMERHLAGCALCAAEVAELREQSAALRAWSPGDLSEAGRRRIHAAVDARARGGIERLAAGLTAVAAAVAVVGGLFLAREPQGQIAATAPWEPPVVATDETAASREIALAEWVVSDLSQDAQRRFGHEGQ